ncbi:hypothetical protein [Deinococcus multiflagellatus]|uniref:Lipoprotein n=1 Tax=Deinococcus multiflagellatus TaxID=1656887 RepID=A0ABW1ZR54_9DEIO|nr:hypothetical protein [Deinococcus multiflagellatus]MBZ9715808.1 hypothetical protein [Deinococcus multiflagellatus]
MTRVPVVALLLLLAACAHPDPAAVLARFDPAVTTAPMEAARVSALQSPKTVKVIPGRYCTAFEEARPGGLLQGRLELTLNANRTYALADRYVFGGLVRARNEVGLYRVTGHALSLVSAAGTERSWPLTSAASDRLQLWGALPLARAACTSAPLTGHDFQTQWAAAQHEQNRPVPWAAGSAPDLTQP